MWGIYLILGLQSLLIGWLVIQWFKFKSAQMPKMFSHDLEFKFKAPEKLPEYVVYPTHKNSNTKSPPTDKIKKCEHKDRHRLMDLSMNDICLDCGEEI